MIDFRQLSQDVIDGNESPLRAFGILKDYENEIKECIDQIKDHAIQEASKHDKKFFADGYSFERRDGSVRLDYSNIEEICDADAGLKFLKDKYKQAYRSSLKNLMAVNKDGELLELPIAKFGSDVLIVKKI